MIRLRPSFLILGFALIPAVLLFFVVGWALGSEEPEPPPAAAAASKPAPPPKPITKVLVSARRLPIGTLITPEDLKWKPWGDNVLRPSHLLQGKVKLGSIIGAVVRTEIPGGKPIAWASIVRPEQQGFLAAVLTPNYRAATISVGRTSSHAGLLYPGDRVDVLFTVEAIQSGDRSTTTLTKTILHGVRVVAVNRMVESISPEVQQNNVNAVAPNGRKKGTITLEVSPSDAERLVLAQAEGTLSLTVRPMTEVLEKTSQISRQTSSTGIGDLLPALRQPPPKPPAAMRRVRILRGGLAPQTVSFSE